MYTNSQDEVIVQNLDNEVFLGLQEWTRLTLPYKIEWQASGTYFGPNNTAQGRNLALYTVNTVLC
jgi:hypothetical protein